MEDVTNNKEPDPIDGLSEPTPCALVTPGGHQQEIARGVVHPGQSVVHTVAVQPDSAVVQVDYVYAGHENDLLPIAPNDEITTLGEALLQRIQWKRSHIVVRPPPLDAPTTASQPPKYISPSQLNLESGKKNSTAQANIRHSNGQGKSADIARKVPFSKPAPSEADIGNKSSNKNKGQLEKKTEENVNSKSIGQKYKQPLKQKKSNSNKALNKKLDVKESPDTCTVQNVLSNNKEVENKQKVEKCAVSKVWTQPNPNYVPGKPLMTPKELEKTGPSHMVQECNKKKVPVVFLDCQGFSMSNIVSHREFVLTYLTKAFNRHHVTKKFIMFPYNCAGHWILVLICLKWGKVWYLDSTSSNTNRNLSELEAVIDEHVKNYTPAYTKGLRSRLYYSFKFPDSDLDVNMLKPELSGC
ncbi:hypothetical protein EJB05_30835, partial [Eragrostis curvula]